MTENVFIHHRLSKCLLMNCEVRVSFLFFSVAPSINLPFCFKVSKHILFFSLPLDLPSSVLSIPPSYRPGATLKFYSATSK